MRHKVSGILVSLNIMAGAAIFGAHNDMDVISIVLESICMRIRPQHVAFGTSHHRIFEILGHVLV